MIADIPNGEEQWTGYGAGMVAMHDGDRLMGNLFLEALLNEPSVGYVRSQYLSCSLEGTVAERERIDMDVECPAVDGLGWSESITLIDSVSYELQPSSLDTIAGNYTLDFRPQTNTLNINGDGVIFAMYHNGPRCTVNGQVSLIDSRFNLYWVKWRFSSCEDGIFSFPGYEGAEFSGILHVLPPSIADLPDGSIYLLISGQVDERFEFVSVIYDPV